jgi:hypothetical protein
MGSRSDFPLEKLIIGVLTTIPDRRDELRALLEAAFGPADWESPVYNFTFTDYYNPEMGSGIKRYFLSFADLVNPSRLPDIKIRTNLLEDRFRESGNRKINLDPGSMSIDRLVLATTKNRGHRIPLQNGIYGEITLIYQNRNFQPLPWTYADFRTEAYRTLLKEVRKRYLNQLKQSK